MDKQIEGNKEIKYFKNRQLELKKLANKFSADGQADLVKLCNDNVDKIEKILLGLYAMASRETSFNGKSGRMYGVVSNRDII